VCATVCSTRISWVAPTFGRLGVATASNTTRPIVGVPQVQEVSIFASRGFAAPTIGRVKRYQKVYRRRPKVGATQLGVRGPCHFFLVRPTIILPRPIRPAVAWPPIWHATARSRIPLAAPATAVVPRTVVPTTIPVASAIPAGSLIERTTLQIRFLPSVVESLPLGIEPAATVAPRLHVIRGITRAIRATEIGLNSTVTARHVPFIVQRLDRRDALILRDSCACNWIVRKRAATKDPTRPRIFGHARSLITHRLRTRCARSFTRSSDRCETDRQHKPANAGESVHRREPDEETNRGGKARPGIPAGQLPF
jgi:hypothetical protein